MSRIETGQAMRIGAIKQGSSSGSGRMPPEEAPAERPAESRALVALAPPSAPEPRAMHRQAPFLAHLIATKAEHPQTRQRRRATPDEAIAAYRATMALMKTV